MIRNLLILAGSVLFTFLLLEAGMRLFTSPPPPPEDTLRTFTEYDPELGWRGVADARGVYNNRHFTIRVALNSGGWRDDEVSLDGGPSGPGVAGHPARRRNIVLLGDSYAWGFGVERGEMFADRLEEHLPDVNVLNYGMSGYGTDQELLVLRSGVLESRPDAVLIQFSLLNDLSSILGARAYDLPKPRFVRSASGLDLEGTPVPRVSDWDHLSASRTMRGYLIEHSWLYSWMRPRWRVLRTRLSQATGRREIQIDRVSLFAREPDPRLEEGWRLAEELLKEIRDEARGVGTLVILLPVSDPLQVDDRLWSKTMGAAGRRPSEYDRDLPTRRLAELCDRLGIRMVDPLGEFRKRFQSGQELFIAEHDPHWNAEGHRIAGEALAKFLSSVEMHP